MATDVATLVTLTRRILIEPQENFWLDAELVDLMNLGVRDLWRDINDLDGDYFWTLDITNVTMTNAGTTLAGVPTDVARVLLVELRVPSSVPGMKFEPRAYGSPDFTTARGLAAAAASARTYYYALAKQGAPIVAPTIVVAPQVNATVNLTLAYVPVLTGLTLAGTNPVPGESDMALIAWCVAYARSKEREDRAPDDAWLGIYAAEKKNLLDSLRRRRTQFGFVTNAPVRGGATADG